MESERNRPQCYGPVEMLDLATPVGALAREIAERVQSGIDPSAVASQVLEAIRQDELYVFTHSGPIWRSELKKRFDAILAAMDKAAAR